jgi:hypothetical protein
LFTLYYFLPIMGRTLRRRTIITDSDEEIDQKATPPNLVVKFPVRSDHVNVSHASQASSPLSSPPSSPPSSPALQPSTISTTAETQLTPPLDETTSTAPAMDTVATTTVIEKHVKVEEDQVTTSPHAIDGNILKSKSPILAPASLPSKPSPVTAPTIPVPTNAPREPSPFVLSAIPPSELEAEGSMFIPFAADASAPPIVQEQMEVVEEKHPTIPGLILQAVKDSGRVSTLHSPAFQYKLTSSTEVSSQGRRCYHFRRRGLIQGLAN